MRVANSKQRAAAYLALCVILLASCSSRTTALIVTGESLKGVGSQFVAVAPVYKHGCDVAKTIAPAQCNSFRTFGERFQLTYPLAVSLWEASRQVGDAPTQAQVEEVIVTLAAQLSAFALQAIQGVR